MKIFLSAFLAFACSSVWAQSPTAFEVASIHPSEPDQRTADYHTAPGEFSVHNATLRSCIEWAYDIKPIQLMGPSWIGDERFDINARAEDRSADDDKLRPMVQKLLADRFGLKVHHEQKEQPIYSLTVAKSGPKFHATGTKDGSKFLESTADGPSSFSEDKTGAMAQHVTIDQISEKISQLLDRMIVNKTGLQGRYDLRIDLTPYMNTESDGPRSDIRSVLFEGFNDQLGLKLEPGKEIIDFVVIDSINKAPTEN